jgi:hypothetical protein
MSREWTAENDININNKTMEGMLIEVFGCMSLSDSVITLGATRDKKRVKHEALQFPVMLEDSSTQSAQLA